MKQIEKQVIRKRITLIKKGKAVFASALRDQYQSAINAISHYSHEQLKDALPNIVTEEPIQKAFDKMYPMASDISTMWRKHLLPPKKDGVDDMYNDYYKLNLREFARTRAGRRIKGITETTRERIANVINYAMETGGSINDVAKNITYFLMNDYREFTPARAAMISQTEMGTAANEASVIGARSTGLEMRKYWSTSGLPNVRDSHLSAEADSNDKGGYKDGELFNNGLEYPCDPKGAAEEVINCHCGILWEVV